MSVDSKKETAHPDRDEQFEKRVRRIDRELIGLLINVVVSICTTLLILNKLGYWASR